MKSSPCKNNFFDLQSYAYDLPESLIAQEPLRQRDQARLMVIDRRRQMICHDIFARIADYLPEHSHITINNSKVIPARLLGHKKSTGAQIEIFLLKSLEDGFSFEVLLRPLKKLKEGDVIEVAENIEATLVDKNKRIVKFNQKNLLKHLETIGHIPLPPYIKRSDTQEDKQDYQTVYAKHLGSVASPTAGLHFTDGLMASLQRKGHSFLELTLHINYGTFKPVETPDIRDHVIHVEPFSVEEQVFHSLKEAKKQNKPVVAVGTTSCRVLETLARGQLQGESQLFIYPGFEFQMVDALVTNFHLPHSTLLMLVCAFGGYDLMMRAYKEAIKERYRFYSYGDAMLIL